MTARVANRNGEPAWKNAPPRMRASKIERPFGQPDDKYWLYRRSLQPMPQRPWWVRIWGRGL